MRKFVMSFLLGAALVALPAAADDEKKPKSGSATATAEHADRDATYGTVKEFRKGDEITINVPNYPDKSFNLNSTDEQVVVATGLKVGDRVKVVEREHDGKKMVQITKWAGQLPGGAAAGPLTDTYGGAASRTAASDKDATVGTVKEIKPGDEIVINVKNWPDKSYDLTSTDQRVMVDPGLQVGDRVKVVERDQDGKKTVHISKYTGAEK